MGVKNIVTKDSLKIYGNPNLKIKKKITYLYVLTPSGIAAKTKITINFMKRKMKEYDELKAEIRNIQVKKKIDKDLL